LRSRQAFANVRDVNETPLLALAGLAVIALLATRLPRPHWPRPASLDLVLAAGGLAVLLGIVLGPGIDLLTPAMLRTLAPVTALAIGWIGARLGAGFDWRYVRRVPRGVWLLALVSSAATLLAVAVAAWFVARLVPPLGLAWTPRLPAILALAAVAATSEPGAVARVAQAVGMRRRATRALGRVAALETACGALAMTVPLALHRPHQPAGSPELGWLSWIVFAVGSSALVGLMFVSFTRLRPAREDMSLALLASLLFGAGIGYAAELSPFVVCALAAALIVNLAPRRHAVQRLLADGERPLSAVVLVIAGALLALPTAWILAAVPLLAALRIAAMWASVRGGRVALQLPAWPRDAGLATVAQGAAATALGLNFFLVYGGPGAGSGRAVLTTVLLGVVVAQAAAPPLLRLGLRAAPAPLTRAPVLPELSPNAPAD